LLAEGVDAEFAGAWWPVEQPGAAIKHTDDGPAVLAYRAVGDGADHGVEPGTVAATGQDADAMDLLGHALLSRDSVLNERACSLSSLYSSQP
jgi:hypothetical protein